MPVMNYNPRTFSDPSNLTEGMHPAYLIEVVEEAVPQGWAMGEKDSLLWRWNFAVWQREQDIANQAPELQSMVSSRTFSSGGKYQASKAFTNMRSLMNREIGKGEAIDPNDHTPLPGLLYVSRRDKQGQAIDFANVKDLAPWPEGNNYLTAEVREKLRLWWEEKRGNLQSATPAPGQGTPQYNTSTARTNGNTSIPPSMQGHATQPAPQQAPAQPAQQPAPPAPKGW